MTVIAVLALAPAADAQKRKRVKPLKAPSFSVALVTADQVSVLERGTFVVRVTARRTASIRLEALAGPVAIAPAQTFRFRTSRGAGGPRRKTFTLRLSEQARRVLSTCITTTVTINVRARGYGSPGLKTRRRTKTTRRATGFRCRDGRLVRSPSSRRPGAATPNPKQQLPIPLGNDALPPTPPSYWMGIGAASIAPEADGKWKGQAVNLGGYGLGAGRAATGILGEGPMVRAAAITDGAKGTLIVANLETQGWFADNRNGAGLIDIRRSIVQPLGGAVTPQQVIVQSNHSHGGADPMGVWGGVPTEFIDHMAARARRAMLEAYVNRRPGKLVYGAVDGRDLLSNQFDYDEANKSVDSEVRVLQAQDPQTGRPFATLLNFSAHSTVLGDDNTRITGDWGQAANQLMEQRFGGRAMTMIGTFGRTQPNERGDAACKPRGDAASAAFNLCKIDVYGRQVVDRTAQALRAATEVPAAKPRVDARSYLVTDPSSNAIILGLEIGGQGAGAPFNRSLTPPWQQGNVIGTSTASALVGDVLVSGGPGEMYPQIPLKVRDTVKGLRGYMTAGLANDQLGYLIAPFEAYPEPIRRSFFTQEGVTGDEVPVSPIDNDNYFFNVSHTMGERVTCSLLRGAEELLARPNTRSSYNRCALFGNDQALPAGSDDELAP